MSVFSSDPWQELLPAETPQGAVQINEYFARHPERMLGELMLVHGQYRNDEPALVGTLTPEILASALAQLPAGIYESGRHISNVLPVEVIDWSSVKDGAFAEIEGQLVRRVGRDIEPVSVPETTARRIREMMGVRDAVRGVFRTQLEEISDHEIIAARHRLNRKYDTFVAWFGPLSARENVKAFASDPDLPLLLSLEDYNPEARRAAKTAIFHQRTIERQKPVEYVETAAEALLVSLNETARVNWQRMEQVTGRTQEELEDELGNLVFLNPEGGVHETAEMYLSGNVRAKLAAARAAARVDPQFQRNADALEQVQPKDLDPVEIEATLGSPWIPITDIRDFVIELLGAAADAIQVSHSEAIATWTVTADHGAKGLVSNTTTHGTARFRATELIEDSLNGRTPTAYDEKDDGTRIVNQTETLAAREKQQRLKELFRDWVWSDPSRADRLAHLYNWRYNNLRLRSYDGSHLSLPGMVRVHLRDSDLARHQKNAVWQILESGSALVAHEVGAGKTWTMTAAAMELKRLGLARKPMIAVPNHLVHQWGAEFLKLYPQARLFVAGKEHFAKENRRQAMSRIGTGDFDAVIVAHRSFEFLPLSDQFVENFVEQQVQQIEDFSCAAEQDGEDGRLVKELEKAKKRLQAKLRKRANREAKDETLTFEELGIDYLFVDEADLFKNLFFVTKKSRIAGLPNVDSNRAFDMYLKVRYLRERYAGGGVVFATGTPIANTIAEMFTMLRYLAPELLIAQGTDHFDAWAANFAREVTSLELAPDGSGYRMNTRFAKFVNLPELLQMFRSVADVQTAATLQLPRPAIATEKAIGIAAPPSPELTAYVQSLVARAERLRKERIDPREDNMLKITSDGRKAALDMRLIDSTVAPAPDTKVNKAIDQVFRIWQDTRPARSTQLVFIDLSTPDPSRFNVYDEVRSKLIERGVPKSEIAFIHDSETDQAKKLLYDAVNAGRIRILLGSTEKMGTGANLQKRLIALHHLDAPWRPRDIEQREGRILRQGNSNPEVWIYRYVTEGSFDGYMWQTLEVKARFIAQVMTGDVTVRSAEDLENAALTYAEIKAIASGNPAVVEKIKVDTELRRLDQLHILHQRQKLDIQWSMSGLTSRISQAESHLRDLEADIVARDSHPKEDFEMVIGTRRFTGKDARKEAAEVLTNLILSWRNDPVPGQRGSYRGFEIWSKGKTTLSQQLDDDLPALYLQGRAIYHAKVNPEMPLGTLLSIDQILSHIDRHLENEQAVHRDLLRRLADYEMQLSKPFEHEEKLRTLLQRQAELAAALDLDKADQQASSQAAEESDPAEAA